MMMMMMMIMMTMMVKEEEEEIDFGDSGVTVVVMITTIILVIALFLIMKKMMMIVGIHTALKLLEFLFFSVSWKLLVFHPFWVILPKYPYFCLVISVRSRSMRLRCTAFAQSTSENVSFRLSQSSLSLHLCLTIWLDSASDVDLVRISSWFGQIQYT